MSGRGPRAPRGGGRGNPARGRGDGDLAPQGRGRSDGAPPQEYGRGGRGDGRGGRGDGRGGRGDGRGAPHGGPSFRRLGDDEHTPGPKIFRLVLRSNIIVSLLTSLTL